MRISSVGTVWHRESLVWKRVELIATPRTTTENRRVFEVAPPSPVNLPRGQRETSAYQSIADADQPVAPKIDDWF